MKHPLVKTAAILLLLSLTSCLSMKPGASRSGRTLFDTFYVGEEGTQYFIKPLSFQQRGSKEMLTLDFTFRFKDRVKDSAVINLSLYGEEIIREIDSLVIVQPTGPVRLWPVALMFNEKKKDGFHSRFTADEPLETVVGLFGTEDWEVKVYHDGDEQTFLPGKRSANAIQSLDEELFVLMR